MAYLLDTNVLSEIRRRRPDPNVLRWFASVDSDDICITVLVLGEDMTNTAPRLALALRQSVLNLALELVEGLKIPGWLDAAVRARPSSSASRP